FSTLEDVPLSVASQGLTSNDFDAEGDALTVVLVTNVTHGTLLLSADGAFTYTPAANYNGSDSFSYRPRDPVVAGNVTVVTINIAPQDDPPVAVNDSTNTLEDTSVTVRVLRNDSEADGEALTITSVFTTNGTVVVSNATNVIFTPALNYFGVVNFSYVISDGTSFATGNVAVAVAAVNDPPTGVDDSYTTSEDVPLTVPAPGVLANDSDVDSAIIRALLVTNVAHGTLSFSTN